MGTDSMERDPIASHKSYTNQLYPTCNPQSTPSHPPPQVRAAGRIVDTSWFAVPGGVCAISRSNRKAGQARVRQTDNTIRRKKGGDGGKGPDPTTRRRCMSKKQRLWCTHAPLRSALFSNLMFPPSIFFSRMLCCDTPMTLGLGCPAVLSSTRNRGHRMGEKNTLRRRGGRAAGRTRETSISRCVCAVAR
jgi:hypothetical protein